MKSLTTSHTKSKDLYQTLDIDHHIETVSDAHLSATIIHEGYNTYDNLRFIEDFVEEVVNTARHSTTAGKSGKANKRKPLTRHFNQINFWISEYNPNYVYCPQVQIFFDACCSLGISGRWQYFSKPNDVCIIPSYETCADLYDKLIEEIQRIHASGFHQRRLVNFNKNIIKREARALLWEHSLFQWRSRQLILLLTLTYKKQYRAEITLEQLQQDLFKLLNNRRHNELLSGIEAYAWKIEDGRSTGLHIHLLLVYSTASNRDIILTECIGRYWESVVTDGKGQYNNENKHKASPWRARFGKCTGQINHCDEASRKGLRKLLVYLSKSDQYLRHKTTAKTRVFQLSQIPEKSMAGRPRRPINSNPRIIQDDLRSTSERKSLSFTADAQTKAQPLGIA